MAAPRHPVVLRLDAERAADLQLRLADRITAFAGSMPFVFVHAAAFSAWMLFFEQSPGRCSRSWSHWKRSSFRPS
jgi:hypothetical protein